MKSYNKNKMYLALDLEMNQPSGKVIEVGVCIASCNTIMTPKLYSWYVNPNEPITEFITGLTGITDDDVINKSTPVAEIASTLSSYITQDDCYVNPVVWGGGDHGSLMQCFNEHGVKFNHFGRRWMDVKTIHTFLQLIKGDNANGGLRSCMGAYNLKFEGDAHRASADAHNTLRLFFHIMEKHGNINQAINLLKVIK